MTINFICPSCKKKVKAPEKAGGKWGNCPHCNLKCYIPLPPATEEEELKLAPVDFEDEKVEEQKMRESIDLQLNILHETSKPEGKISFNEHDEKMLWKNILLYLRGMADGELDEAEQILNNIVPYGDHAREILANIAREEKPEPELADIAGVVLKGLMKNLLSEIKNR